MPGESSFCLLRLLVIGLIRLFNISVHTVSRTRSHQALSSFRSPLITRKPRKQANLQNALMQLRKICNHPFVFREVDEDFSVGSTIDEQIVRTSGKFELLDRILPKLFKTGHRVSGKIYFCLLRSPLGPLRDVAPLANCATP